MLKKLADIDRKLVEKYMKDLVMTPEESERVEEQLSRIPDMILESDLESVLSTAESEAEYEDITVWFMAEFIEYEQNEELRNQLERLLEQAETGASIRRDFAGALRKVRRGTDLSYKLGFAFSNRDLKALTKLHKSNKFRKKIEDLLGDCNFHTECGLMAERNYQELDKLLGIA